MIYRQCGEDCLHPTRCTKQMASHGLGRVNDKIFCMFTKTAFYRHRFSQITQGC